MCYGSWSSLEAFLSRVNIQATVSIVEGADLHQRKGRENLSQKAQLRDHIVLLLHNESFFIQDTFSFGSESIT